jgi:hypothetical protein
MEIIKKTNKATLIAAALIITGATGIFSTYANNEIPADQNIAAPSQQETVNPKADGMCFHGHGMFENLTEEQKTTLEQAHQMMKDGDKEGAKALLEEAGIRLPAKASDQKRRLFI